MSDLLSSTIASFEQWRNDKPNKCSPVPLTLRQQALALLPDYSRSKIALSLRISGRQLKQWSAPHAPNEREGFVELPSSPTPVQPWQLDVKFNSGDQLCFSGAIDKSLIVLIMDLMKS
jgi:hypothetical protein